MKTYRNLMMALLCLFAMSVSSAFAEDRVYLINKVSNTEPMLMMNTVTLMEDETVIDFTWKTRGVTQNLGVYLAGHEMAFYIKDPKSSQKYYLLDVKGIAIRPGRTIVGNGESINFRLTFEKIPMTRFHLIEGQGGETDETAWVFLNVKLK